MSLNEFILTLAKDPKALQRFQLQPDEAIRTSGLSAAEQAVVASKNPALIRSTLVAQLQGTAEAAWDWVVVIVTVKSPSIENAQRGYQSS